jgi:hypothetical protein
MRSPQRSWRGARPRVLWNREKRRSPPTGG